MRTPCFAFGLLALVVCTSAVGTDSDDAVAYKQVTMKVNMIGYTEATFNDKTRAALRSSLATVSVIPSSLRQLSFISDGYFSVARGF
jgi:hypothetical protein